MRIEKDFIGEKHINDNALYGINSIRAAENFPDTTAFHIEWYKAMGEVKTACYITYQRFKRAAMKQYSSSEIPIDFFDDAIIENLILAAKEVSEGKYFDHFIVPAVQGGAGTSINMNINEIIANVALMHYGKKVGDYQFIDPFLHANVYQSTNDTVPTALKVAIMKLLNTLEDAINKLRFEIEHLEKKHRDDLRIAYTQMQEAVPSSFGKLFSTYNDALSRDWWRVSKCFERIKTVNLGGSAIGTAIAVPRFFVMEVVQTLREITKLPVTRGENMQDTTANLDSFVEIHATLKSHAVNLEKMVNDLRLLSSEILQKKYLSIPQKQVGSSIMPSKVNPVIPEFVIGAMHKVYANDLIISNLSAQGCLDLNAYLPIIGHALIESLKLLIAANSTLKDNLIKGIRIDTQMAVTHLYSSPSITTALSPYIGYHKAAELAKQMRKDGMDIFEANNKLKIIDNEKLSEILKTDNLLKTGFSLKDLM